MPPRPSTPITSRPYGGLADLRALQGAITTSWLVARPLVNVTAGDVAWWVAGVPTEDELRERVRLWTSGSDVVAWGWFRPPGTLEWHLRADLPAADRRAIAAEILDWLAERAGSWPAMAPEGERAEAPSCITAYVLDTDQGLRDDLAALGWRPADEPSYSHFVATLDAEPASPALPPGYTIRSVRGEDELAARVEVHRAAFAPSRMTLEKYRRLLGIEPYAFERDLVVEAPDGSLAAFTIVWWDPIARVGELEPVGTHPDHRGKGLGKAVCLAALHVLRRLGALDALVFSLPTNAASEALYASAGFRRATWHRAWSQPLGAR